MKPVGQGSGWKSVYDFLYHAGFGNTGLTINRPLVTYLLKRGFPPLYTVDVIKLGNIDLIKILEKIQPFGVDRHVVKAAIASNNPTVLRYILDISETPSKYLYDRIDGEYFARPVKRRNLEMVKILVETGADMTRAIETAAQTPGALPILEYLLSVGYRPPLRDSMGNIEALTYIIDNYGDIISGEEWLFALKILDDTILHPKPSEEALYLFFDSHKFSKEQLTKLYRDHVKYNQINNKQLMRVLREYGAEE